MNRINITSEIAQKLNANDLVRLSLTSRGLKNTMGALGVDNGYRATVQFKKKFLYGLTLLAGTAPMRFYKRYPGLLKLKPMAEKRLRTEAATNPVVARISKPQALKNWLFPFFKVNDTVSVDHAYLNAWMYLLTGKVQKSVVQEIQKQMPSFRLSTLNNQNETRRFYANAMSY